jgi:hypothetical protein
VAGAKIAKEEKICHRASENKEIGLLKFKMKSEKLKMPLKGWQLHKIKRFYPTLYRVVNTKYIEKITCY